MATVRVTPKTTRRATVVSSDGEDVVVRETVPAEEVPAIRQKTAIFRTYQIVWYVLGFIEAFLAFRFLFKLLGASLASPFVQLIYNVTDLLTYPFVGIFPNVRVAVSIFDWASLIGMGVYALLAYAIVYLFQIVKPVEVDEVEEVVDNP